MFGQFVVLGGGYSPRQGSEDLSETALSVPEATKIGISWGNLIVFFWRFSISIFFSSDTRLINYLNNLMYNSENLYHFFKFVVSILVSPNMKIRH